MKQVLDKTQQIHYIEQGDMIRFICKNTDMEWNSACYFVSDHDIGADGYGPAFWEKDTMKSATLDQYNAEQIMWINGFFEAHPWIEKMMIVFND
jgi:hypothetical protein